MEIKEEGTNRVLIIGEQYSCEERTSKAGTPFLNLCIKENKQFYNIVVFNKNNNINLIKYKYCKGKQIVLICDKGEYNGKPNYTFNTLVYADLSDVLVVTPPEVEQAKNKQKVDDFFGEDEEELQDEDLDLPF